MQWLSENNEEWAVSPVTAHPYMKSWNFWHAKTRASSCFFNMCIVLFNHYRFLVTAMCILTICPLGFHTVSMWALEPNASAFSGFADRWPQAHADRVLLIAQVVGEH